MQNMKKGLILLLAVVMLVLAVGCHRKKEKDPTVESTIVAETVEAATEYTGPVSAMSAEEVEAIFGSEEEQSELAEASTEPTNSSDKSNNTHNTDDPDTNNKPSTGSDANQNLDSSTNETQPEETTPSETQTEETVPAVGMSDYERYHAMSGQKQMEYMQSFDSVEAFFRWYNQAKADYEAAHPDLEIGNGNISLENIPVA